MALKSKEELDKIANYIRKDVVLMTYNSGVKGAHLGGSMSIAEIMAVLYGAVMNVDPSSPYMEDRDRVILSKAHAAMAWYSALSYAGFISRDEIENAMRGDSKLFEHPKKQPEFGIESSGGSLGMGLSFGMGMGLGLKKKGNDKSRVFVILGDGECDEGSVWEAASAVVHYGLNNVIPIIDKNGLQFDGTNDEIMDLGSLPDRWRAIGFDVIEIDGHDVMALQEELSKDRSRPTAIYCNTVKGKGVSFAENVVEWHTGRLTDEMYEQAMKELSE